MTSETTFASLGLAEPLLRAIAEAGYTQPTPIQAQAIPQVLAGGDLLDYRNARLSDGCKGSGAQRRSSGTVRRSRPSC